MKKSSLLFFILFLIQCAPSKKQTPPSISTEEAKTQATKFCFLEKKNLNTVARTLSLDLDPSFENYIVKYKTQVPLYISGQSKHEYTVKSLQLQSINANLANLKISGTLEEKRKILKHISSQLDVEYIEPDYPVQLIPQIGPMPNPNDPYFTKQWFHSTLKSLSA